MLRGIASIIQVRAYPPPTPHPCRPRGPRLPRPATPSPSLPSPVTPPPPVRGPSLVHPSPCFPVGGCYTHGQNSNKYLSVNLLRKRRRDNPDVFRAFLANRIEEIDLNEVARVTRSRVSTCDSVSPSHQIVYEFEVGRFLEE